MWLLLKEKQEVLFSGETSCVVLRLMIADTTYVGVEHMAVYFLVSHFCK
jgi:hypothetical protein